MKTTLILAILCCLSPFYSVAQTDNVTATNRVIDSLLSICEKSPNFSIAIKAGEAAKDSILKQGSNGNMRYTKCAASLGIAYRKSGRFKEAEGYLIEAKALYEQFAQQESVEYASVLSHLGVVNAIFERPGPAETYMIEAKNIFEKISGKNSIDYANSTYNLALFYYNTGKYDKSAPLYQEAVEIQEQVAGKDNMNYALYLNGFANNFIIIGQYERAEPLSLEAKDIRARVLGKDHPDYILSLASLGNLYRLWGQYKKAEGYYVEVIDYREKKLGKNNPDYATAINNLGTLYTQAGRYDMAEPLMLEAKDIREKTLSKKSQGYATSANLLAAFYQYTGQYNKSEALFLEVIAIREKMLGKEHSTYALSLNNLASLYNEMGQYEKALPLCLESKAIREKSFGKQNPDYAASVMNLANVYKNMGRYSEAEMLYLESKEIGAQLWGEKHPEYAEILGNMATFYTETKRYDKATPLYLSCKKIQAEALGTQNPMYTKNLGSYARMLFLSKQNAEAIAVEQEYIGLQQQVLTQATHYLSEQELSAYVNIYANTLSNELSYARMYAKKPDELPGICYDNVLFFKGFLLSSINQFKKLALSDEKTASKYELLGTYRRRIAVEYAKPIAEQKNLPDLEAQANALEKELARTIKNYSQTTRQVKYQDVQASLKPGSVAVEFVHYRYKSYKLTDSILYAALILKPEDSQPQFIPLFEEKELTPLLKGATGGNNFLKINALYAQNNTPNNQKSLYELIWQPLENALKGSKIVYCAPSGLLHRINLSAIQNSTGQTFSDQYQLVLVSSTRQLVVPNTSAINFSDNAYLAGGIRYESNDTAVAYANRGASSRIIEPNALLPFQPDSLSISRGGVLDYLPATATEVRGIAQTLASAGIRAQVDTGLYATEESFRQLGVEGTSPRIIHVATHGYFFPDPVTVDGRRRTVDGQEPVFKISENPMIRSGLIMAGAKQAWLTGKHPEGKEDGILTAYEISQMNLAGTELAVLSACETGLGDIVGNEGVFGLQRAFKIAGAKYLIMSLWKVDDKSTQDFMTTFYKHWLTDKQSVPEAFRTTQREMRVKRPGAYDWAGFVLIE
ncbi:MAG: CHAT domain-containing tetratricopeptide repeat protein [Bacteroidota bacterium]